MSPFPFSFPEPPKRRDVTTSCWSLPRSDGGSWSFVRLLSVVADVVPVVDVMPTLFPDAAT